MTFLNKSLWASGFSGQKRSIDCGDRFGPLDTGRVHSWSLEEPKYCKLVHSQEKYVEIQPLNNWPEMSFGQNLRHLMIFLWIILGRLLWAKNLWRGHMLDLVGWKLSYHIFSFHIWTLGISFTGGFTYSPCLVSWTRWPRTDIVFHSHSDASTVRTVGGKQPKAIFPFCQVKRSRMQHMQEQTGGKGETCYPHFSPRGFQRGGFDPKSKDEEVPWIGYSTPYIPIQQGQSTVPRLCGVNRVLLTAGFNCRWGGTCFPHLARTRRRIELLQNFWKGREKEVKWNLSHSHWPLAHELTTSIFLDFTLPVGLSMIFKECQFSN